MVFRSKKKKSHVPPDNGLSRKHALACIPVRNPEVREQKNEQDELCLTYQVRFRPWFQGIVQKITGKQSQIIERKLQLDELGSSVWQMINGKRSVHGLISEFQATHKLNQREAEISVTAFLKELGKRGVIVMREKH
jgi:hypothetical protein